MPLPRQVNMRFLAALLVALWLAALSHALSDAAAEVPHRTRGCSVAAVQDGNSEEDSAPDVQTRAPTFHRIQRGENLEFVGRKFGKTWEELHELNPNLNVVAHERCAGKPIAYRQRPVSQGYYCNDRLRQAGAGSTDILGAYTLQEGDLVAVW